MQRARPWLGLAAVALLAALATWMLGTPDTGAPLRPVPAPTVRPVPSPGPRSAVVRGETPDPDGDDPEDDEAVDLPPEPFDLNRTYDLEHGFAEALVARTDRLAACWAAYLERAAEPPVGRFTVELMVKGDGNRSEVGASVVNEEVDGELEDCVSQAMADVRFEPVTGIHRFVMAVPIPSSR